MYVVCCLLVFMTYDLGPDTVTQDGNSSFYIHIGFHCKNVTSSISEENSCALNKTSLKRELTRFCQTQKNIFF